MSKPQIMYYHDGRHPHIYRYEPPMYKEEYIALVDELAGTPIDAIAFCLGEGRTMLHDTKAGELLGHNQEIWEHAVFRRAHQNAKYLIESGDDPLRIICERAHLFGIKLYPTPGATQRVIVHYLQKQKDWGEVTQAMQEGALVFAKIMLGRIRSKYSNPPGPGGGLQLDGQALLQEAAEDKNQWEEKLINKWGDILPITMD